MDRRLSFAALFALLTAVSPLACGGSDVVIPNEQSDAGDDGSDAVSDDGGSDGAADAIVDETGDALPMDGNTDTGGDGASDAPSDGGDAGKPCTATGSECSGTEYCDAPTCASGVCRPRPAAAPMFAPTCGCDGVTYFNATIAESKGRSVRAGSGACAPADSATCGGITGKMCPHDAEICAHEVSGAVSCTVSDGMGTCWELPAAASCPMATGKGEYTICGASTCTSLCKAVTSGAAYYHACK